MRFFHAFVAAFAALGISVVACSGGIDSSCGSYVDDALSYDTKCDSSVTVTSQEKTNFVKLCDALAVAPGASNLASQIDQCASQIKSLGCNESLSCKITGSLADGAACGASSQCSGGVCTTSGPADPNTELQCGKCSSFVAVGGDCTNASCDPTTGACEQNKCAAYVQQGADCTSAPCKSGLLCDSTSHTCQPYPTKGQPCSLACAFPEKCAGGTCIDPVQQGGACPTGFECASNLTCDSNSHTCVQPTLAAAGQPCGFVQNQIIDCQSGLRCSTSSGTCVTPKEIGDSCTVGKSECDAFLLCIGGTCQAPDYSVCK